MDYKKEIIKKIDAISGKYSPYEVFTDWIQCCALAFSNSCTLITDSIWKEREKQYLTVIGRYTQTEAQEFSKMLAYLTRAFENNMSDILGEIYMEAGMGNKSTGQFFTPYHVSRMCAEMVLPQPDENGVYRINEPSCGGGGMIIAVADVLKTRGINYKRKMDVIAQDLDWKGVYMCYLQLSLLGIAAIVVQGNTLLEPYKKGATPRSNILVTPAKKGMLL